MVFSGAKDIWFGPMAPAQAAKFEDPFWQRSPYAGHELPVKGDPTFDPIIEFIRAGAK